MMKCDYPLQIQENQEKEENARGKKESRSYWSRYGQSVQSRVRPQLKHIFSHEWYSLRISPHLIQTSLRSCKI